MTGAGRLQRTASAVLVWALLVAAMGVVIALLWTDRRSPIAAAPRPLPTPVPTFSAPAPPAATAPTVEPAATTPPTAVAGAQVAPEPADPANDTGGDSAPTTPASAEPSTPLAAAGEVTAPAVAVSCRADLALEDSPDAPYSFLCLAGAAPISWPNSTIRLFTSNLTPAQTIALPVALAQWQSQAHFDVTLVNTADAANVVLTSAALSNNEDGYTSMHYVCEATCSYDHADVRLTSTAELTKSSWIATILHELGHVAGLNHVARHSEVMYPQIDSNAPVSYGSGDLAGFRALEAVRAA